MAYTTDLSAGPVEEFIAAPAPVWQEQVQGFGVLSPEVSEVAQPVTPREPDRELEDEEAEALGDLIEPASPPPESADSSPETTDAPAPASAASPWIDQGDLGFFGGMPLQLKDLPTPPSSYGMVTPVFDNQKPVPEQAPAGPSPFDQVRVEELKRRTTEPVIEVPPVESESDETIRTTSKQLLPKRPVPPSPKRPISRQAAQNLINAVEVTGYFGDDIFGRPFASGQSQGNSQASVFGGPAAPIREVDVFSGAFTHGPTDDPFIGVAALGQLPARGGFSQKEGGQADRRSAAGRD